MKIRTHSLITLLCAASASLLIIGSSAQAGYIVTLTQVGPKRGRPWPNSLQFYRARVFGSFSHRDLRFGQNQVWRFALSTCSFEVEKEKRGLFIGSEGGSGVIGGETLASCKKGVFAANEERPARVRNRF
jgi:hypothetical protein